MTPAPGPPERTYLVQMTRSGDYSGGSKADEGVVKVKARYAFEALDRAEQQYRGLQSWYVLGTEAERERAST